MKRPPTLFAGIILVLFSLLIVWLLVNLVLNVAS